MVFRFRVGMGVSEVAYNIHHERSFRRILDDWKGKPSPFFSLSFPLLGDDTLCFSFSSCK
jgi:hypothetical protein